MMKNMQLINDLGFVRIRLDALGKESRSSSDSRKKSDRATELVDRWRAISRQLAEARTRTLRCCEARAIDDGNSAALVIADKAAFDTCQEDIQRCTDQLTRLEGAIRELDSMGAGWYSDLEGDGTDSKMRERMNTILSGVGF